MERLERRVQALELEHRQAQAILESMVEGVVALDRQGRVLWLNGSAQQLFGLRPDVALGKRLTEFFRQPEAETLIEDALRQRRAASQEVHTFDPSERVIRLQVAPCEGGEQGAALVLMAQDVTDIRRLEGMRREFVANVSHELKTPLTSIKGLVETLLGGALEDAANNRRFVSLIEEDTTRLSRLIDDLLELSQIESKATLLKLQPVSLRPFLEGLAPQFQQPLTEHQVTLALEVAADLPPVAADPERLRQVFVNLLDNAVKFNRPGGWVAVRAAVEQSAMRIAVEDTGIGIPEADLPRIFERFYRVDKARSRALGGTGLGLSIVKHLVELHRGTISVRSLPGHGSTFTLTLPLA
jgi:two-component system phosphate regulon sensor histidine kinase PhoR